MNSHPTTAPAGHPSPLVLTYAHHVLLGVVGYACVATCDAKLLWDKLAAREPVLRDADFVATITDLLARGLLRMERGKTLALTDAGRATLDGS